MINTPYVEYGFENAKKLTVHARGDKGNINYLGKMLRNSLEGARRNFNV
jgi:hypothetical protein